MTAIAQRKIKYYFKNPFSANDLTQNTIPRDSKIIPKDAPNGHNPYIFNEVRQWAYKEIKFYIKNYAGFLEAITDRCNQHNQGFSESLPTIEVNEIATSITNWIFARLNRFAGSEIGRRKSLKIRKINAIDKKQTIQNMEKLGYPVQTIADSLGISRKTVWRYLNAPRNRR